MPSAWCRCPVRVIWRGAACRRDQEPAALTILGLTKDFKIIRKPRASCSRIRRLCCSAWRACRSPMRGPGPDGTLEVWAVTDHPAAVACPDCGTVSGRVHETVLARPRDVRRAGDQVRAWWVKRRWKCDEPGCARKTFTEWVPQVPPRCRLTRRLREQAGAEVAERGITPAEAARHAGSVVAGGA